MSTVFSDSELWQHAEFTFTVINKKTTEVGKRGQPKVTEKKMVVKFKMRPSLQPQSRQSENVAELKERYQCRVVSVDGNLEKVALPTEIKPEDAGTGIFKGRQCRAIVKSVSQSSLSPILEDILGASTLLEIDYSIHRGVSGG